MTAERGATVALRVRHEDGGGGRGTDRAAGGGASEQAGGRRCPRWAYPRAGELWEVERGGWVERLVGPSSLLEQGSQGLGAGHGDAIRGAHVLSMRGGAVLGLEAGAWAR